MSRVQAILRKLKNKYGFKVYEPKLTPVKGEGSPTSYLPSSFDYFMLAEAEIVASVFTDFYDEETALFISNNTFFAIRTRHKTKVSTWINIDEPYFLHQKQDLIRSFLRRVNLDTSKIHKAAKLNQWTNGKLVAVAKERALKLKLV